VIGVHIAARCYEVRNTLTGLLRSAFPRSPSSAATSAPRRSGASCMNSSPPGSPARSARGNVRRGEFGSRGWPMKQTRHTTSTRLPRDFHRNTLPVWKLTSTELDASGATIPHDERDAGPARPHNPSLSGKTNETRRDETNTRKGLAPRRS
jgi:hypothetical protein